VTTQNTACSELPLLWNFASIVYLILLYTFADWLTDWQVTVSRIISYFCLWLIHKLAVHFLVAIWQFAHHRSSSSWFVRLFCFRYRRETTGTRSSVPPRSFSPCSKTRQSSSSPTGSRSEGRWRAGPSCGACWSLAFWCCTRVTRPRYDIVYFISFFKH